MDCTESEPKCQGCGLVTVSPRHHMDWQDPLNPGAVVPGDTILVCCLKCREIRVHDGVAVHDMAGCRWEWAKKSGTHVQCRSDVDIQAGGVYMVSHHGVYRAIVALLRSLKKLVRHADEAMQQHTLEDMPKYIGPMLRRLDEMITFYKDHIVPKPFVSTDNIEVLYAQAAVASFRHRIISLELALQERENKDALDVHHSLFIRYHEILSECHARLSFLADQAYWALKFEAWRDEFRVVDDVPGAFVANGDTPATDTLAAPGQ